MTRGLRVILLAGVCGLAASPALAQQQDCNTQLQTIDQRARTVQLSPVDQQTYQRLLGEARGFLQESDQARCLRVVSRIKEIEALRMAAAGQPQVPTAGEAQVAAGQIQARVQTQPAEVQIEQDPAEITVDQSAARVQVQQAAPQVTVVIPEPVVIIEQAPPQVTVKQPEPRVTVTQAEPVVQVIQAEPQVEIRQADQARVELIDPSQPRPPQAEPQAAATEAATTPPAGAQQGEATAVRTASAFDTMHPGDLVGHDVETQDGTKIGGISRIVRDSDRNLFAVMTVGSLRSTAEKTVAVPLQNLQRSPDGRFVLTITEEQVKGLPSVDTGLYTDVQADQVLSSDRG